MAPSPEGELANKAAYATPREEATSAFSALWRLVHMAEADFDLLDEVVKRASTRTGQVIIPVELFTRIQQRCKQVHDERSRMLGDDDDRG